MLIIAPMRQRMKRFIYAVTGVLCCHLAGCGPDGDKPSDFGVVISTDVPVEMWVDVLADSLTPEQAAESTVAWMCTTNRTYRGYAHELVAGVVGRYGGNADSSRVMRYTRALDSVALTLPDTLLARVLTVAATPRALAAKVKVDADSARLVDLIQEEYRSDSSALEDFILALD